MKAKVHVTLKAGVLDPQGKAIEHALDRLGFDGINEVRQGKYIEIDLEETDPVAILVLIALAVGSTLAFVATTAAVAWAVMFRD